jgi:hypothetical protein
LAEGFGFSDRLAQAIIILEGKNIDDIDGLEAGEVYLYPVGVPAVSSIAPTRMLRDAPGRASVAVNDAGNVEPAIGIGGRSRGGSAVGSQGHISSDLSIPHSLSIGGWRKQK